MLPDPASNLIRSEAGLGEMTKISQRDQDPAFILVITLASQL